MKQEIKAWVEGVGAKKISFEIEGDMWVVDVAHRIEVDEIKHISVSEGKCEVCVEEQATWERKHPEQHEEVRDEPLYKVGNSLLCGSCAAGFEGDAEFEEMAYGPQDRFD